MTTGGNSTRGMVNVRSHIVGVKVCWSIDRVFCWSPGILFVRNRIRLSLEKHRLQIALDDVKKLSGFLPICSNCKKIRDDKGYWNQIEKYILEHSEAEFTHGICPGCTKKLYPDMSNGVPNEEK